jgi:hypothetical protein
MHCLIVLIFGNHATGQHQFEHHFLTLFRFWKLLPDYDAQDFSESRPASLLLPDSVF